MKRLVLAAALLLSAPFACAAPPSDAQIDTLMDTMDMRKVVNDMMAQMDSVSRNMGKTMLGENVSAEQQKKFDRVLSEQQILARKTLTWEKLSPIYHRVYAQLFTADEVQAMTAFYGSEHGRSIMTKMPQAMQLSMQEMMPLLQSMMQDMQKTISSELSKTQQETTPNAATSSN